MTEKEELNLDDRKVEDKDKILTVEESQIEHTEKLHKEFFDEEDEITEINWD